MTLRPVDPQLLVQGTPDDPRLGSRVAGAEADAPIAIVGCADDTGVANSGGRTGAALGPTEIRRWLYKQTTGLNGAHEELTLADLGDVLPGETIEATHAALEAVITERLRAGQTVLFLGGGHDLAFGSQSAVFSTRKGRGAVVNLDTHLDVRPLKEGRVVTSGTPFRRLIERFGERVALHEFGIQPQHNARAHAEWLAAHGGKVTTLAELRQAPGADDRLLRGFDAALATADFATVSLDLDVAAASVAPGTSAPPADGLSVATLARLSSVAGRSPKVALLDLVELSPPHDENGKTARLAALCAWEFLAGFVRR